MSQRFDLNIDQGADFVLSLTLTDNATPPVPINLTGATLAAQIRNTYSQPNPAVAAFTCQITDAPNGRAQISLSAAQTSNLPVVPAASEKLEATVYDWDVYMTSSLGVVTRLLYGYANILPRVTQ